MKRFGDDVVREAGGVVVWVIVVAAGGGTRFGRAKQFEFIGTTTVLGRSVDTARRAADGVVVVLPSGIEWDGPTDVRTTVGGATRSESVRAGLALVPENAEIIVVHDAARPVASDALYRAVVDAVRSGADAAIPALAVSDTLKRVDGDRVVTTVARDELVAVQTPQAFAAAPLRLAHADGLETSDDAAAVEASGGVVVVVAGEPTNIKITLPDDLVVARAILEQR